MGWVEARCPKKELVMNDTSLTPKKPAVRLFFSNRFTYRLTIPASILREKWGRQTQLLDVELRNDELILRRREKGGVNE